MKDGRREVPRRPCFFLLVTAVEVAVGRIRQRATMEGDRGAGLSAPTVGRYRRTVV